MPATLTPPEIEIEKTTGAESDDHLTPLFNVVLMDDDDHTYDYVIDMLVKLFLKSKGDAFRHAVEVDSQGRTVVLTCELPAAEYARDQIHAFGADHRMERSKGSMSARVEPATGTV